MARSFISLLVLSLLPCVTSAQSRPKPVATHQAPQADAEPGPDAAPVVAPASPAVPPPPALVTLQAPPIDPMPAPSTNAKQAQQAPELLQLGLLLQGWFLANTGTTTSASFRVRRAELSARGELVAGRFAYRVSVDLARVLEPGETRVLVDNSPAPADAMQARESVSVRQPVGPLSIANDITVTYLSRYADVSLGQMRIPVSFEGLEPSGNTLLPQRSPVVREFGDQRDVGVRASKSFGWFAYTAGVFNGSGPNTLDHDVSKDGALRLEFHAFPGFTLAGSVYATLWKRGDLGAKDRYEVDVRYRVGALRLDAEFMHARDVVAQGALQAQGGYVAAAYRVLAALEPVLRVGHLDHDIAHDVPGSSGAARDELWHFDAGLNYFPSGDRVRLSASYSRLQYDDVAPGHEFLLQAQLAY